MYSTAPLVAAVALVLGLAACGGGGTSSTAPPRGMIVKAPETTATKVSKEAATDDSCRARLGNFLDRMDDLRQSLLAGLSYDEYVLRVRAVRDAYEAVPVDKLGATCVTGPAAKAEDAFNEYLRAANAWGECAATAGCAASEVEAKLQHRWKLASKSLEAAEGQA